MNVTTEEVVAYGGALVAVCSVLANVVPKHTWVGRFVHFVAANWGSRVHSAGPGKGK